MHTMPPAQDEQAALWNGAAGRAWVENQDLLDRTYRPMQELLVEAVAGGGGRRVLDVGCGTGGTTVAIARALGSGGRCTGVDVSAPMIAAARERAERDGVAAEFVLADAQEHPFEPASVDTIVSRLGVMFFGDPVRAFANLRRAATGGARAHLVAWRSPADNPFMTLAERAAAPLLPALLARDPDAPGQFAFADSGRVRRILRDSGWTRIDIRPIDVACAFPAGDLDRYLGRFGPVGRALLEADEGTRARIVEAVRPAFDPYVHGAEVRFEAACWRIEAQAPAT